MNDEKQYFRKIGCCITQHAVSYKCKRIGDDIFATGGNWMDGNESKKRRI